MHFSYRINILILSEELQTCPFKKMLMILEEML